MRRSLPLAVVSIVLIAGGCGRGDEATEAAPDLRPEIEPIECAGNPIERQIPSVDPPDTLPTELVTTDIRTGAGRQAQPGDTMFVDYIGIRSSDGLVFDSSYTRDAPANFALGQGRVIAGWDQGLVGVQAGAVRRLDIPASLAYGDSPPEGLLEPGDALTFLLEVRAVVAETGPADAPLDLDIAGSVGATEVITEDLASGDGQVARLGDTAIIHALLVRGDNRVVLLNTWERNGPLEIDLDPEDGAIPGFVQGLQCVAVGTRRVLTIPPEWAFGPDGEPSLGLPAGIDLVVIVDVVGVY